MVKSQRVIVIFSNSQYNFRVNGSELLLTQWLYHRLWLCLSHTHTHTHTHTQGGGGGVPTERRQSCLNHYLVFFWFLFLFCFLVGLSPWYNCTGWLGIKHQLTDLVRFLHSFPFQMWHNLLTKSQTQKVGRPTSATSARTKRRRETQAWFTVDHTPHFMLEQWKRVKKSGGKKKLKTWIKWEQGESSRGPSA